MPFHPALTAPKARQGWEAAHLCISREAKPAKIDSLLEKDFCARQFLNLKGKGNFSTRQCRVAGMAAGWSDWIFSGIFDKVGSSEVINILHDS